jgi:putative NADH-flavin reductase
MKIAIVAAAGRIGSRLVQEALDRGHEVTAIVRDPAKVTIQNPRLTVVQGDALNVDSLVKAISGHEAVVSAYSPGFGPNDDQSLFSTAGHNLVEAVKQADVPRLLVVGGASSLEVAPGVRLLDTPNLPDFVRPHASAAAKVLDILRESDIDWTYFSPAIEIEPGTRTGQYRLGKDNPIFDAQGQSHISMEDYAVAMLDEVEQPQFIRQRFTAGY